MADMKTALEEAFSSVEKPAEDVPPQENVAVAPAEPQPAPDRERDESGRFVAKAEKVDVSHETPTEVQPEPVQIQRPSTWKKEYWPLYDKLAQGQAITPEEARKLAEYTNERENQFKAGVSTYKAEADKAKEVQEAIAPFLPELQRYNIPPGQWIANLGRAHQQLALGSPEQKLEMFRRLATEYGVPLEALGATGELKSDPQVSWVTQQLQALQGKITGFETAQQQQEQRELQAEISRVRDEKDQSGRLVRPHFEAVRDQMSGLLQSGFAQSLEDAYTKAVRLNDDLWQQTHALQQVTPAIAVAKAKAAAVSPKSASPGASMDAKPKGLRETLASQLESISGSGRV
jgi:hypothetical protein